MTEQSLENGRKNWAVVSRFTGAVKFEDRFLDEFEQFLQASNIEFVRLEYEKAHRAIVLALADLNAYSKQPATDLVFEGISEISDEAANQVVFHSTIDDHTVLSNLFFKEIYPSQPKNMGFYAGVHRPSGSSRPQRNPYRHFGITKSEGTLQISQRSDLQLKFELFEFPPASKYVKRNLTTGAFRKISEGGDNLRRREGWFRRRFGHKE